jgi:hypothetical protein
MKQLLRFLVPLFIVILSCQKKDSNVPPQFLVAQKSITLEGKANAEDSLTIQSNINWTISVTPSNATWLKLSATSGAGNSKIIVTAIEKNLADSTRSATLTITPSNTSLEPVSISVTQLPDNFWSTEYGGSHIDHAYSVTAAPDGGLVIVGSTLSNDGDVTGNHGSEDAFVLKLDANGKKLWSKTFGGSADDYAFSIVASADGGFVIAGSTRSNDGDVSGNHSSSIDAWVLKLDANGNKKWSKLFGGTSDDYASSIVATSDGAFVIAGETMSFDGDISGYHSGNDAWVLKLDANGNKLWSKAFGGSNVDIAHSITATADGGLVMAGETWSNDGDLSSIHGSGDSWILKLDVNGNKVWSRVFGGSAEDHTNSIITTTDGGFMTVGITYSNDGDVSSNQGNQDAWLLKLDANGNKLWSKAFGGTSGDYGNSIIATRDGGFVMAGTLWSTYGDVSGNFSSSDNAWVLKVKL